MDDLDALKRITEFIRLAREEMNADLDAMDYKDLARVVPGNQEDEKAFEKLKRAQGYWTTTTYHPDGYCCSYYIAKSWPIKSENDKEAA